MSKQSKRTLTQSVPPPRANLEFLVVWLMATSNRIFFIKGAKDEKGQHWNLHDPSDKDPTSTHPRDGLFKALDWERDIEPLVNGFVWEETIGEIFENVNNKFYDAAKNAIPKQNGVPRYSDHICPPLSEIAALLNAISGIVIDRKARTKKT